MIYYSIPWNTHKHIGLYYNQFMALLCDDDYACFIDGDSMFTTSFYGKQLEAIVKKHPECGLFTARTNRIGCKWQRYGDWHSNDMEVHRGTGKELAENFYDHIEDVSNMGRKQVMGGVLILIRKSTWRKLEGFKTNGALGVDNDIHWRAQDKGEKVYLMLGMYMMHWYRGGDTKAKQHLI